MQDIKKRVVETMIRKQSNLCLAADVVKGEELLRLAEDLGSSICVLKTHIDIISDFSPELVETLKDVSKKKDFLIFEDRKFADIGNTVKHQYQGGVFRIAEWADLVNAHILPGPGVIEGLREVGLPRGRGLLLLAQMSSRGHLLDENYSRRAVSMAQEYSDFVVGFIAQKKMADGFLTMTPGVKMRKGGDGLGQQYQTPEFVVKEEGSDIIIVGRGIYEADDPIREAERYRQISWRAYLERTAA